MEFLNEIWLWILGILGGVSYTGIIAAVIYGCLKGGFNRTLQKMNIEKINENLANKQMERIKQVSFKQNIQPIVESELKKVTETANEYIKKQLEEVQKKYDNVIAVLEKFYAYFDDSLVSDSKKQDLKQALQDAKTETSTPNEIEVSQVVIEEPKEEKKEKIKKTKIER